MRLGVLEVAVIVRVSISFAAPEEMPDKLMVCGPESSLNWMLPRADSVGTSFTELTVTVKVRDTVLLWLWPSFTVTVINALPLALATGVKVSVPVAFGLV